MNPVTRRTACLATVLCFLAIAITTAGAQTIPSYSTTYTITVSENGAALWQVEYRTLLGNDNDVRAFNNYSRDLPTVYTPQLKDLMQRSADEASVATSRQMGIGTVTGDATIQTSPTGRYGVVDYSFTWTEFALPGNELVIGDSFAGGLYLGKDTTLVIRYPPGWTVGSAEPAPDEERDGLIWYGLHSFPEGEPRVTLKKAAFPEIPVLVGIVIAIAAAFGFVVYRARKHRVSHDISAGFELASDRDDPPVTLSDSEQHSLEERIIRILTENDGEQYQSEIVRALGEPKSTVSSALNALHQKGIIQKIRKGRENLIRLTTSDT